MDNIKKEAGGYEPTASIFTYFQRTIKPKPKAIIVKVRLPDGREIVFTGQVAKTVLALVKAGRKGVTALEISSWALRLSAYIHILRHEHGIPISMKLEPHDTGLHGRYFLDCPIVILEQSGR